MKVLQKTALLLLLAGITHASTFADNEADSSDVVSDEKYLEEGLISITDLPKDHAALLVIRDEKGKTVQQRVIEQGRIFARKNKLSQLPDGEYTAALETDYGVFTESFFLEAGKIHTTYFKPALQEEEGFVKIAFTNRMPAPLQLKVYDIQGEVLYETGIPSQEAFTKGLDLSQLKAGQYTLALQSDHYVYSRSIHIQ